jgi:hypothetical protein
MRPDGALAPPTESTYVATCGRQLWEESGTLLPGTLLALLLAGPWLFAVALGLEAAAPLLCTLTGAPAWLGLVALAAGIARGEATPLALFPRAVRRRYWSAAALGAATAGFAWAFERGLRAAAELGPPAVPALAVAGAGALLLLAIDVYAFPLLALQGGDLRRTVRLALGLAAAAPGPTVGLLAAGVLAGSALAWLGPGSLLVTLPAMAVLQVNNVLMQARRFDHP